MGAGEWSVRQNVSGARAFRDGHRVGKAGDGFWAGERGCNVQRGQDGQDLETVKPSSLLRVR